MKNLALFILLMICISCSYSQIYKWVDSQGVVHFTDKPHDGAQEIKIPEAQTYVPPNNSENGKDEKPNEEVEKPAEEIEYTSLEILQPENEATIRNNQGFMVVAVDVKPALSGDDKIQLLIDGQPIGKPQITLVFQISGIFRGAHKIAVQIVKPDGTVIKTSDTIEIFMQRPRVGMGNIKNQKKPIKPR